MNTSSTNTKKHLKVLQTELKVLQEKLVEAHKLEGKDSYIDVQVTKNQAHFEKRVQNDNVVQTLGKFYIEIDITAKQGTIYIPLSIASGKKTAGFMYQIEGTAEGRIVTAEATVRGEKVSQVTLGTLLFAKIPVGHTASFQIRSVIRGQKGKVYTIVITRIHYKPELTQMRYLQYQKEIQSERVKLS